MHLVTAGILLCFHILSLCRVYHISAARGPDKVLVWHYTNGGVYSAKLGYKLCFDVIEGSKRDCRLSASKVGVRFGSVMSLTW